MGVTIRYRGQLADREKINSLCDDLIQVAEKMQWSYNRLDEVCGVLSRITGNHLERLSPEDIATMIEGLLHARFDGRDGE